MYLLTIYIVYHNTRNVNGIFEIFYRNILLEERGKVMCKEVWKKRGEIIKNTRIGRGLLQKDLAKFLGVKENTISGYENGTRRMDFDTVKEICKLLEIDIRYF